MADTVERIFEEKSAFERVEHTYQHVREAYSTALKQSETNLQYLINDPYTDKEKTEAERFKKPLEKFNIIVPTITAVVGNEQVTRKRAIVKGRDQENIDKSELYQGRWNALEDEQDIESLLQTAFIDTLTTRKGGFLERSFKIDDMGYLEYSYSVPNNMRVFLDPETRASDYMLDRTCDYVIKETWLPFNKIEALYGIQRDEMNLRKMKFWQWLKEVITRVTDNEYSSEDHYDQRNNLFRVVEMQERVARTYEQAYDGQNFFAMDSKTAHRVRNENPGLDWLGEFSQDRIHRTAIVPAFENAVVWDEDDKAPTRNFDVFPIFCYDFNVQIPESICLVDLLRDAQDDINKGKSQIRDYVTQILAGMMMFDKSDDEAKKEFLQHKNEPNYALSVKNLKRNRPERLSPGTIPPDVLINTENSRQYAEQISYVNAAMQGRSERSNESGRLYEQKVNQVLAAINPYYKNVSKCRKAIVKDFVDLFPWVYSEPNRVINMRDESGEENMLLINTDIGGELFNDTSNPSMRVELDEGETNLTYKEQNFERLLAIFNIIAQANPQIASMLVPELIREAPVKGTDRWLQIINQTLEQQSQQSAEAGNLDRAKKILDNYQKQREIKQDDTKLLLEAQKLQEQMQNNATNTTNKG